MSLLYRIIYAAHANGTHHKLALDALQRLHHPDAEAWRKVFLKHVALYLEGSKDPDIRFKDFKNHVLHVRDDYWGGAPEKVASWYQHLLAALKQANWSEAAYAAGVLSHYYTDPIHPFHTGQTEAENNIHRAVEWSINRAYDSLKAIADATYAQHDVEVPQGPQWLHEMTCDGADFSHRYYEKLIAHYDINRGVVDPPAGLDTVSRNIVAELIAYAATGFARILDRAFDDCGQRPPDVSLTLDTVVAALQIPVKTVQKRLANAADRELVQRMYDELKTTGTVSVNLPEDDRQVRDLHAKEVLAPRAAAAAQSRARRLDGPVLTTAPQRQRGRGTAPPAPAHAPASEPSAPASATTPVLPDPSLDAAASRNGDLETNTTPFAAERPARTLRTYLAATDPLAAAPSIGDKTAARFANLGVLTVGDFLSHAPEDLAPLLGQRAVTAKLLTDWQAQARLVMAVPGLRGTHAQLLVASGYRDVAAILAADADRLCADVLAFAMTASGQRLLRDGGAPDLEKIKGWIASAAATAKAA